MKMQAKTFKEILEEKLKIDVEKSTTHRAKNDFFREETAPFFDFSKISLPKFTSTKPSFLRKSSESVTKSQQKKRQEIIEKRLQSWLDNCQTPEEKAAILFFNKHGETSFLVNQNSLKKCFRSLAKKLHPDTQPTTNPIPPSEFIKLQEHYKVLKNIKLSS